MLSAIDQQKESIDNRDMLELLRRGLKIWVVILCHGGKFALQVYQGSELIHKESDSKYVSRKK